MTVVATKDSRKVVAAAGDPPVVIPFNQYVESSTHIKVYADTTLLAVGTNYTITGIGDLAGIEVTITSAPITPVDWVVLHDPLIDQNADLSVGGSFGTAYENALDALTRRMQALENKIARGVLMDVNEVDAAPTIIPGERTEGNTLVYDANGNLTEGADQGEIEAAAANAAAAAASALAAANSALAVEEGLDTLESQIETIVPDKLLFEGDGVTTNFLLGRDANETAVDAYISGVWQNTDQYSITGVGAATEIAFSVAPPASASPGTPNIAVKLGAQASIPAGLLGPDAVGTTNIQDDAVTTPKMPDGAVTRPKLSAALQTEITNLTERSVRGFGSKTTMEAATIDASTKWAMLTGRVSQGDGGQMLLRRLGAAAPATGYPAVVSADGSNWEYVPTDWSVTFEQFGAVGDGVTDDYAACQAAVDFIYARGGGVIRLGWNKVYALSNTLFIWQRVRLIGVAGAWMNQYSTGGGLAAPVPLGSALYLKNGVNKDVAQFRFNCFNDGGTLKEVGSNRFMSDFRHHGGAMEVCFWGNRGPLGTPPTGKTNNNLGNACSVYGARYVWLERNAGMFGAEHGFEALARDYTADFGAGGVVGSSNQRWYYNNGHGNAKSGFLVAMYDSIITGNDAGFNGEDGFTGYGGQLFNNNAAWNNLQRGFNIGSDSSYTTTSALSATFVGNNSYDNEWAGYRMSGNGCPLVVGCFARANGRGKVGADTDNANYVITSTARGSGFVGCQSAAWDYDAVTPLTYYGFFVSNPTYKTAFSGNIDRGCTVPSQISTPANILAAGSVS